ncbi:MAG: MFS transporter [Rhodothermales bacterium]|nr:MFS transporter [Rhodothermales bacterium]MBO6780182.1 MFS transporter [Rhodothermales bacterium]
MVTSNRRAIASWSLYDFANSAFTTLIVTFIYAAYFTQAIAPDPETGTSLWSIGVAISAIIVAVCSPFLGAMADKGGLRKPYLLAATITCVVGTVVLYFPLPGQIVFALGAFVIANVAFEMGNVFYNAYLPDLATPDRIGRVSGNGWALGYLGGLMALLIGFLVFVQPEVAPFGLDKEAGEHIRATNLLVAAWFAVFSIPMFLFVSDPVKADRPPMGTLFRDAARELKTTFLHVRKLKNLFWLLLARLVYNDGIVTIFAFGAIYATGTFGFETEEMFMFGIALNVAAGLGAWAFGFVDDKLGGRTTILISLGGLVIAAILAVVAQSVTLFWISAILVGLLAGPNQAASRSLLGRFIPDGQENEFYGFFAFSGKFTAFMGPIALGALTAAYGQRAGVSVVIFFFVLGAVLLLKVNEKEGMAAAKAYNP